MKKVKQMTLLVLILSKTECMSGIISDIVSGGYGDPTVIDSEGALNILSDSNVEPMPMFGGLRFVVGRARKESKTCLCVLKEADVDAVVGIINKHTGGIDLPDTGIIFTLPLDRVYGLRGAEPKE